MLGELMIVLLKVQRELQQLKEWYDALSRPVSTFQLLCVKEIYTPKKSHFLSAFLQLCQRALKGEIRFFRNFKTNVLLLQLKESKSDKTVVAFLIFPTKTNSFNVESLRGHAVAKGLKDTIDEIQKEIGVRLYETCLRGAVPDPTDLLSKNDLVKLKRCIFAQGASNLPPITTHNIVEDHNDPVMNAFRRCQLFNNHHDRVKVRNVKCKIT